MCERQWSQFVCGQAPNWELQFLRVFELELWRNDFWHFGRYHYLEWRKSSELKLGIARDQDPVRHYLEWTLVPRPVSAFCENDLPLKSYRSERALWTWRFKEWSKVDCILPRSERFIYTEQIRWHFSTRYDAARIEVIALSTDRQNKNRLCSKSLVVVLACVHYLSFVAIALSLHLSEAKKKCWVLGFCHENSY